MKLRFNHQARYLFLLIILFLLGSVIYLLLDNSLKFSEVTLRGLGNNNESVSLPHYFEGRRRTHYVYQGHIRWNGSSGTKVNIIPDDCIRSFLVNGQRVTISDTAKRSLCDYKTGAVVELGPYLIPNEKNTFELRIFNRSGQSGLRLSQVNSDILHTWLGLSLVALLMLSTYQAALLCGLSRTTACILLVGVLVRLIYLGWTGAGERTYDVFERGGHFEYVQFIQTHRSLPHPLSGWEYYQAPLYYLVSALGAALLLADSSSLPVLLQIFSLGYSILFLLAASAIYHRVLSTPRSRVIAVVLTVFWPAAIIHSVRIGNEPLYYALHAWSLFYAVRWYQEDSTSDFLLAAFITSLGLATKSSAIIMIGVLAYLFLLKLFKAPDKGKRAISGAIAAGMLLVGLGISFGRTVPHCSPKTPAHCAVSNLRKLNRKLLVGNTPYHFLYFDTMNFLKSPFTSSWADEGGRQYFWNYLLKTSLFGEFKFSGSKHHLLARSLSFLLLFFLALLAIALALAKASDFSSLQPLIANFVVGLLLLIAYRALFPAAPNGDFRLVYPILISLCSIASLGISVFRRRDLLSLEFLSYFAATLFILFSAAFFVFPSLK